MTRKYNLNLFNKYVLYSQEKIKFKKSLINKKINFYINFYYCVKKKVF